MSTHQDWEKARTLRDAAAHRCARHLLRGDDDMANLAAEEFEVNDKEMLRISRELDD